MKQQNDELLESFVRLNLTKGVGCTLASRLLTEFPDVHSIFDRSVHELTKINRLGASIAQEIKNTKYLKLAKDEIKLAEDNDIKIFHRNSPEFPLNLALQEFVAEDTPIVLYVKGSVVEDDKLAIGIVGKRNPSFQGIESAKYFSGRLVEAGFTIVSGFARGIDSTAHETAINVGGRSLAFIGSGLLDVYPPENKKFAKEIVKSGALISEFPLKTPPETGNFPRRNRLIAAMSLGVLVVEAEKKSGSLITARLASEYGREVFALPGRYNDMNTTGCNKLIQDGAKLVLELSDILNELPSEWVNTGDTKIAVTKKRDKDLFSHPSEKAGTLTGAEKKILGIVTTEPLHVEKIATELKMQIPEALSALVMLEIKGLVKQLAGKFFIKS